MDNFREHAETSGSEILSEYVSEVTKHEDHFHVKTSS
jgi:thioredoxin reductase